MESGMVTQEFAARTSDRRLVGVVLSLTLGLFALACFLPAVDKQWVMDGGALQDTHNDEPVLGPGWSDLAFGWLSGHPAWLANPTLALGIVLLLCGQARHAAVVGVLSASLGLATWTLFGRKDLYVGYYAWQASQLVFAGGATWVCLRRRFGQHASPILPYERAEPPRTPSRSCLSEVDYTHDDQPRRHASTAAVGRRPPG